MRPTLPESAKQIYVRSLRHWPRVGDLRGQSLACHRAGAQRVVAPPREDFGLGEPVVYRGAYEFSVPGVVEDFIPQQLAPEQVAKAR